MPTKIRVYAATDSGETQQALPDNAARFAWLQASPRNALVFANEAGKKVLLATQADDETYYLAYSPATDPDDVIATDLRIDFAGAVRTAFTQAADALA